MYYVIAGLIGLFSGAASGLFGVGGGIVMVPAMMFFMHIGIKPAIGTSLAVIVPTALMGVFEHSRLGDIEWRTALALAPTAVAGGYLGSWLTSQIPAPDLKRAFGAFLIIIGVRLLVWK